jgi:general nucleoside transport system permease protein
MSEATMVREAPPAEPDARVVSTTRLRGMGVFVLLLGAVSLFGFALTVERGVKATFLLTSPPAIAVSPLVMPVRGVCIAMAVVCFALGAWLVTAPPRRGGYAIFGIGVVVFTWGFLVWAARGGQLDLVQLLAGTLVSATPLVYGALSGVMCERSGVVNIAIEGQFLAGAFLGAMIASASHNLWLGVLGGVVAGALFGALLAFLTLRYGADQIIVGVVIVAFCTGLTNYLTAQVLTPDQATLNSPSTFDSIALPGLSKIPILGPVLFDQNIFVYGAAILLVVVHVSLFHTRWGLRVRAVGEHPRAAATVGIHVVSVRYRNVILGGVIAGIGGASFTIGSVGEFSSNMTAGLGYVALAAMIFGRWRPFGALSAALLFGFAVSLQSFLAVFNIGIPAPILAMTPYVITIAVVSGLVGRVRPPAADGVPYVAG